MSAEEAKQTAEEKKANCASCGKPIKRLKRYYRDGKFYCTKKCWKNSKKPKEEKNEQDIKS